MDGCLVNTCRFWWLQKSVGCQGMAPHPGILVPQSEQPVAAQSAPSSNCICLTFLENRRKARKHMGILLLFAFPSPRHLAGASQRSRQVRGSARSLWCPDSFLTSCNCFPATTLLSRELLAKAICSPSIFISCFVHVKEGKTKRVKENKQSWDLLRQHCAEGKVGRVWALQPGRTWQP